MEEPELSDHLGTSLNALDHGAARAAIARLRKEMEESGTWQPRVGEGPDQEGDYLGKLKARQVPIEIRLIDGEKLEGTIQDFTPYLIRIRQRNAEADVSVRKLAIAFYRTQVAVNDLE
jgi:sRNA-binding regulator protein Hfq